MLVVLHSPFSFCSFIPILGDGLYHKDNKVGQILAVGVGSVRSALLHHRSDGNLEWAADGCGDQRHPGQSEYQWHLCDDCRLRPQPYRLQPNRNR